MVIWKKGNISKICYKFFNTIKYMVFFQSHLSGSVKSKYKVNLDTMLVEWMNFKYREAQTPSRQEAQKTYSSLTLDMKI